MTTLPFESQPATAVTMSSSQLKPSTVAGPDESTDGPSMTAVSGVPPAEVVRGLPSQLKPPPAETAITGAAAIQYEG